MAMLAMTAALLGGLFCVCMAGVKNRDLGLWLLLGAFVPVVSVLLILVLPTLDDDGRPLS